jgi:hypothetical protein
MVSGQPDIRIGNAERDAAVSALGEHLSSGRLEMSEYEERCGLAAAARTRSQLEELFTDLPAPHPDLSSATWPTTQLITKAGHLVPKSKAKQELVKTPASSVFEVLAGMCVVAGIPAAILLTVFLGAWWMFIAVPAGVILFGSLSDALKKKPAS